MLTQDFSVMDLFAGVQKLNEDYDVLPFGRETIGSPYSPTPSPQHQFFFFSPLQERNGCLCLFLHSSLWEAWWLEGISAVHSPVSPWSGAKLLPNKTGCIPRAPPSSLQSGLVFAPFI